MIRSSLILLMVILVCGNNLHAQTYHLNAGNITDEVISGHLKMGHPGPEGKKIEVNNRYLTLDGEPFIPVMGEMHFSRIERERWEDVILKMKANGINIIASYFFWNHHEEIEGQFDWTGNNDFRSFVKLCAKHDLWVYPRLGPWCHGEVRNGGTPDWILEKTYMGDRSNHPAYQAYVERWYSQMAMQMSGLYYKDGGPVVGVQLENEYWRGEGGEAHIMWLKETARQYGIDVPLYTITGWRNTSAPQDEVIPLWGGYPAVPWATHINPIKENLNYVFEAPVNIENIGNEESQSAGYSPDYSRYPYFTCEMGVGNQISYHRRPVIGALDGLAIATIKTGSGSNLPGYYVFAGGNNPVGTLTTLEEERDYTGYWNEYPVISYDFQAAITETGELAPSYHQVKKLHYFLNEFGDRLAPMSPVIPKNSINAEDLQYAVRTDGKSGFLFGANYYRGFEKPVQKNVEFSIELEDEDLLFPSRSVDIPDSTIFIWPFNFLMDEVLLKYATAQPVGRFETENETVWVFFQNNGIVPELAFDTNTIDAMEAGNGEVVEKKGMTLVKNLVPGKKNGIELTDVNGNRHKVVVLSHQESDAMWRLENDGRKYFFLTESGMYINEGKLHVFDYSPELSAWSLIGNPAVPEGEKVEVAGSPDDNFRNFKVSVQEKNPRVNYEREELFDEAVWLKASPENYSSRNELHHKIFVKEFGLFNPARVKSAILNVYTEASLRINLNNRWLSQDVDTSRVYRLDVTGYLEKGENMMMVDVPFTPGEKAFVAELVVEYFNSDKVEILTNGSWLTTTDYRIPVPGRGIRGLEKPEFVGSRDIDLRNVTETSDYIMSFADGYLNGLKDVYLRINYWGDKGEARIGHRLVADNFNTEQTWSVALGKFGTRLETAPLRVKLHPLSPDAKIYFDDKSIPANAGEAEIESVELEPLYYFNFEMGGF